ncbi:MAG: T9SS type A sorting domain-containing protein, partial [Bacteroidota bacterium]
AYPQGVALDASGNIYIADFYNYRIRKVTASTGIITTVAGNGITYGYSGDGGAATSAELSYPQGVALDASGNIYIADQNNQRVRKVTASTGIISTVAGNGTTGFTGDGGAATSAELYYPTGVALDASGNIYIADIFNQRIRKVTASTGIITTVAGNGTSGFAGDGGAATSAELYYPTGVALDASGNIYIADYGNNRIRKVTASTGIITTVAGNGTSGFAGDESAATSAELYNPTRVAIDASGNIYIADYLNQRIRKVTASTGIITTVAGNGTTGFTGDGGAATSAELYYPTGVALDASGNIYIADQSNQRVRKVTASTGIITTVAGNGTAGFAGDGGAASSAEISSPMGVALDASGNIYIADYGNHRIREVLVPPIITSFTPANGPVGSLVTITGTNLDNPTAFTIGGVSAIVVSNDGSTLVGMVMPGAVTGAVSVTTAGGTISGASNFTVTPTPFPGAQLGNKIVGAGAEGSAMQGTSVSISADNNTAFVGGSNDYYGTGAVWVYTRSGNMWIQQGDKLVGSNVGSSSFGNSVSCSADGNTVIIGGITDNNYTGAAWVFTRTAGVWTQQGNKLVGSDSTTNAMLGSSVSISADGNTAVIGGYGDNNQRGASWVFIRSGGAWSQQGNKLIGTGAIGTSSNSYQGYSVSISSDGNTFVEGGSYDNDGVGAIWVFTRSGGSWSQQGNKLVGTGGINSPEHGSSVSISSDGNTIIEGGVFDNSGVGAAWVFTRSGSSWTQQGSKLVGSGGILGFSWGVLQGWSISLSSDGNTAIVGGYSDNIGVGAVWIFTRSGGVWTQKGNKLIGAGASGSASQGIAVSLSSDGSTAFVGGNNDNSGVGAAWVYTIAQPPTITSFSPSSGSVGTLVTITGTNLSNPTAFTIGGTSAIVISNTGTTLVAMVMPGATTGTVSLTTVAGTANGASNFTVTPTPFPGAQLGNKIVGAGAEGSAMQGTSVSISADNNTAFVGGSNDYYGTGAVWVYTRSGNMWIQQGDKLVGSNVGSSSFGNSVSCSADGNTVIIGGITDNNYTGAAWVFTRTAGVWTQQGNKLVGSDSTTNAMLGSSVSISADGNTAVIGGYGDNNQRGASWVFIRSGGAWSQQGNKLIGTGAIGTSSNSYQGYSVSISSDGNTFVEGGSYDNDGVGAIWVFTRSGGSWSQQGNKLVGTGGINSPEHGSSVSISSDGNTIIEGGVFDNSGVGAAWVFTRSGSSWTQQGSKLVGSGGILGFSWGVLQGWSISLSSDGNTAIVGGYSDNIGVGAVWIFTRSGGVWTQKGNKLIGAGASGSASQGIAVSLSSDGSTAFVGGINDNSDVGAAWVFIPCVNVSINNSPSIVGQSKCVNESFSSISVTASGSGLSYQWYYNANNVNSGGTSLNTNNGANTNTYTPQATTAGTLYYYCVVTGTCGNATSAVSGAFITYPLPTPTISGSASVCINSTGNIYSTEANMNPYTWNITGGTITSGSATNTVTVTWNSSGSQSISVNYTNGNNCTAASATVKNVTVNTLPVPTISGSASASVFSTGNVYTTASGMTSYSWSVSGGTITAGSTTSAATVTWTSIGTQTISVNCTNSNGCSASASSNIDINQSNQTITFNTLTTKTYGVADYIIPATSTSGLTVTLTSDNTNIATVSGHTVHIVAQGSCNILANQTGNANYNAATEVSQSLTINKAQLTITANNQTKPVGNSFTFTGSEFITSGLVYSDAVSNVTLTCAGATSGAVANYYDIVPSAAIGTGLSNYNIYYVNGTMIVGTSWTGNVSTDWDVAENWSNNQIPDVGSDIRIPTFATNQPHVTSNNSNPAVCNNVIIADGAVLTVDAGKALTVNGTITISGTQGLVVKSDATGTGSLLDNGYSGSGTASIERCLTPSKFHHLGIPISNTINNGTAAGQMGSVFNSCTLDSYNEATDSYVGYTNSNNVIPNKGYVTKFVSTGDIPKILQFVGNPNTGQKSFAMTKSGQGYNLIPNPYPSSIDWNASTGWVKNVANDNTIYIWSESAMQFAAFDGTTGVNEGSNFIASGQSFFLKAQSAGNIQMNNNIRLHSSTLYLKSTALNNFIRLKVSSPSISYSDESVVYFNNSVSQGSEKWLTSEPTAPSLYTVKNAINYSINIIPESDINQIVPLSFIPGVNGNYTINATEIGAFNQVSSILLKDLKTGNTQDLMSNPIYSFASASTDSANRFVLNFSSTSSINQISKLSPIIFAYGHVVYVHGKSVKIEVYSILGQSIRSVETNSDSYFIDMNNEAVGTYIIKVVATDKVYTQKVIIK